MTRRPQTGRLPDRPRWSRETSNVSRTWRAALDGVQSNTCSPSCTPRPTNGFVDEAVKAGVRPVRRALRGGGRVSARNRRRRRPRGGTSAEERERPPGIGTAGGRAPALSGPMRRPGCWPPTRCGGPSRSGRGRVVRGPDAAAGYPVVHEADVADVAVAALLRTTMSVRVHRHRSGEGLAGGAGRRDRRRHRRAGAVRGARSGRGAPAVAGRGLTRRPSTGMIALLADAVEGRGAAADGHHLRVTGDHRARSPSGPTTMPPTSGRRWRDDDSGHRCHRLEVSRHVVAELVKTGHGSAH